MFSGSEDFYRWNEQTWWAEDEERGYQEMDDDSGFFLAFWGVWAAEKVWIRLVEVLWIEQKESYMSHFIFNNAEWNYNLIYSLLI